MHRYNAGKTAQQLEASRYLEAELLAAAELKNPGKNMVSHVSNASLKEAFNISPPKKNSDFVNKRVV